MLTVVYEKERKRLRTGGPPAPSREVGGGWPNGPRGSEDGRDFRVVGTSIPNGHYLDTLTPFKKSIKTAFVYGSIARSEELSESDVDLMIVGTVSLADLSPAIQKAEERLARQVNPTVFSQEEFARKVKQGHHFLKTVLGNDKLFILGSENELAAASHH